MTAGALHLTLYVSGASPASIRAVRRIRDLCARHCPDGYELEIVDVHRQPALVATRPVVAAPTLIREEPTPLQILVGDLTDEQRVLDLLGLPSEPVG